MILLLFPGSAVMLFTKVFLDTLCISWRICSCFELYPCGLALPLVFLIVIGPINGRGNAAYILFSILHFCFSSDGNKRKYYVLLTFNFMQIHRSSICRKLHYSAQSSSTFTAFSLLRLCLKASLCKIHSAIHGVI